MMRFCFLLCLTALLMAQDAPKAAPNNSTAPVYTADGRLAFPANYREWIYLTTGMDMDYNPDIAMAGHSMFDNVFVNPEAYKAFVATGTGPTRPCSCSKAAWPPTRARSTRRVTTRPTTS